MKLNINTDAAVKFTNTLEKLHRSALPVAIRSTLNSAAFDVKKNTMPQRADQEFTIRQPNFFKANSRVEKATGFDVDNMQATVGFVEGGLRGDNNHAVDDLEQQEHGGTIGHRSFIAMKEARGGNDSKPVRPGNRLSAIKFVNANTMQGKTAKEKFLRAVAKAGKGGYVLGTNAKKTLFRIEDVGRNLKLKPLYSFEPKRSIKVRGTNFMKEASLQSANKLEKFYEIEARKQIARLRK